MDHSPAPPTPELLIKHLTLCNLKHGVGIATSTSPEHAGDNEIAYAAGDVLVNLGVAPNGWLTGNVSGKVATGAVRAGHVKVVKAPVVRRASILKRRRDESAAVQDGRLSTAVKRLCEMTDDELLHVTSVNTEANRVVDVR